MTSDPAIDLASFRLACVEVDSPQANLIRERFIRAFVDTSSENYHKRIAAKRSFSDGQFYTGYLWDYMRSRKFIDVPTALAYLDAKGSVYVFWDLHSGDLIRIEEYWKFPRNAVLRMDSGTFRAGYNWLPEDVYVCDDSMEWAIALTHELHGNTRECILVERRQSG